MKNTATLVQSKSFTRGEEHNRCTLCDRGGYDKWTYQYVKVTSGPAKGAIICPDCLKSRNFSERAEGAAQAHEASMEHHKECARLLREQVEWDVPTFEEWETRERAADEAYCKENYPKEWAKKQASA